MSDILLIVVAALAFFAIAGVGLVATSGAGGNAKANRRAQALVGRTRGDRAKAQPGRPAGVDSNQRRKQMMRTLQDQEGKRGTSALDIEAKLRQAGLSIDVKTYWLSAAGLALVMLFLALAVRLSPLVALMVGFVAGVGLPLWVLGFLAKRRRAKFALGFPDAVDIVVRGLRSGLPLHDCLKMISKECPEPLAGEFRRLVEGQALGVTLEQGLERMHDRMPTPELKFFAIVLNIQQKTGGNLGEALGNLSVVLRSRRMMREKIGALSMEAVASAAVIGCLPPGVGILVTLADRHYLEILFKDPRGHVLLFIAACAMGFGTFVMRKMINFKF
jgi:tight adherence protein B